MDIAGFGANHPNHDHKRQFKILTEGTREEIIAWLCWNDRNGIYSDEDSKAEGNDPITFDSAREHMARAMADDLAMEFIAMVTSELESWQLWEIADRNDKETDPNICHSHDFCDANQCMLDALAEHYEGEWDGSEDEPCNMLINLAWDVAKQERFGVHKTEFKKD